MEVGKIFIPAGECAVEIDLQRLGEYNVVDIRDTLASELIPLETWHQIAVEYYKRGRTKNVKEILEYSISEDAQEAFENHIKDDQEATAEKKEQLQNNLNEKRVKIMVSLAALEIGEALKDSDSEKRKEKLMKAIGIQNEATGIIHTHPLVSVCRGLHKIVERKMNEAISDFRNTLIVDRSNIPAILGMANVSFHNGKYAEALGYYRKVLNINPSCPPAVRVGIGLCNFRLGRLEKAKAAFDRVLSLDSSNIEALTGLATMKMNEKTREGIAEALKLLKRAYSLNAVHPGTLNLLAEVNFYRGKYALTVDLAKKAFKYSNSQRAKAESFYQIGRAYHAQDYLNKAEQSYFEAVKLYPGHHMARFGLGQMHISKGDLTAAIECMQKVYKAYPQNHHAIRILGSLYMRTGKLVDGQRLLKKALKYFHDDPSIYVELGESYERMDSKIAYENYNKAVEMYHKQKKAVPYQLWNNIGVLCMMRGEVERAEKALKKAVKLGTIEAGNDPKKSEVSVKTASILYNIAILYEKQGKSEKASDLHKSIVKKFPRYIDSYLRLGCIAKAANDFEEAEQMFKKALELDKNNDHAQCLLGDLYATTDLKKAEQCFKDVLNKNQKDAYAKLALADIQYRLFQTLETTKKQKQVGEIKKVQEKYEDVLREDSHNLYAVNGIGVMLALFKRVKEAKNIFTQIRDADKNVSAALFNLGHVYAELDQFPNAIAAYTHALEEFPQRFDRVEVLKYIARTYYNADELQKAKRALVKALHMCPTSTELWFNLGLSLEHLAINTLSQKSSQRTLKSVKRAFRELRQATDIYNQLQRQLDEEGSEKSMKLKDRCKSHFNFCKDVQKSAEKHLDYEEMQERKRQKNAEDLVRRAEEMRKLEEENRRLEQERIEEERRRLDEKIREENSRFIEGNTQEDVENAEAADEKKDEDEKVKVEPQAEKENTEVVDEKVVENETAVEDVEEKQNDAMEETNMDIEESNPGNEDVSMEAEAEDEEEELEIKPISSGVVGVSDTNLAETSDKKDENSEENVLETESSTSKLEKEAKGEETSENVDAKESMGQGDEKTSEAPSEPNQTGRKRNAADPSEEVQSKKRRIDSTENKSIEGSEETGDANTTSG